MTDTTATVPFAPGMIDSDLAEHDVEAQFDAGASMEDGVSGKKPIDTSFENTSQDTIDTPRSGENAPVRIREY